jgi:1-deoxy-D-xylulose-5-phosphate synthase
LSTGFAYNGVAAVRYPRGSGTGAKITTGLSAMPIGKAKIVRQKDLSIDVNNAKKSPKIAILAFGSMVAPSLIAAETLDATVADMRFIKPLDIDLIEQLANTHDLIVTIEENALMGGAGAAVLEAMQARHLNNATLCLGLPDTFIEHGVHETMLAECGLDASGIIKAVLAKQVHIKI